MPEPLAPLDPLDCPLIFPLFSLLVPLPVIDDEIKLAGLQSLVPEELEKHLILNSNRLRTFKDARLEVVTYVEAKFGLRIRDSKPSDTGARGHSDLMDIDAVN